MSLRYVCMDLHWNLMYVLTTTSVNPLWIKMSKWSAWPILMLVKFSSKRIYNRMVRELAYGMEKWSSYLAFCNTIFHIGCEPLLFNASIVDAKKTYYHLLWWKKYYSLAIANISYGFSLMRCILWTFNVCIDGHNNWRNVKAMFVALWRFIVFHNTKAIQVYSFISQKCVPWCWVPLLLCILLKQPCT